MGEPSGKRESAMEKTIFLFQRHKNRDKQDFAEH